MEIKTQLEEVISEELRKIDFSQLKADLDHEMEAIEELLQKAGMEIKTQLEEVISKKLKKIDFSQLIWIK